MATDRAPEEVDTGELLKELAPIERHDGSGWHLRWLEEPAGDFKSGGGVARRHQAEVADFDEAVGQDVKQKSTDEFVRRERNAAAIFGEEADVRRCT